MIFFVMFGGLFFGGVLILLIARFSPNAASVRLAEQDRLDRAEGAELYPRIPYEKFRHLVLDLLESLGFHVAMEHASKDEIDIICKSTEPLRKARFIVHAIHAAPGDVIDQSRILRLQDAVMSENASRGLLITPYPIDRRGLTTLEADLELIDGAKLRGLIEQYLPKKLDEIEGYRGF